MCLSSNDKLININFNWKWSQLPFAQVVRSAMIFTVGSEIGFKTFTSHPGTKSELCATQSNHNAL